MGSFRFRPFSSRATAVSAASQPSVLVLVLVSIFVVDFGRFLIFRSHAYAGIDGKGYYAQDLANARMLRYLTDAPRGLCSEKVYEEHPVDTGIYGSFAQKPSLVGIPWILESWKKNITELPDLVAEIKSVYAGTHPQASRFLADHDVRYVVWSIRESSDLVTWQSIMQSIDADYRWMEFSTTPDAHVGLWIRR